ncbi:MAG: TonB-dependent receptor [Tannerellaceae bacterium]|jgi:TonB-linked SusC/RagA family outer membrane protein|nr:TonB-dependent receptor [Tannerellaceae bacterium]
MNQKFKRTILSRCTHLIAFLLMSASLFAQVSLDVKNRSIKDALSEIERSSSYSFFFTDKLKDMDKKVSVRVANESIEKTLNLLLDGTSIAYHKQDANLYLLAPKGVSTKETPDSKQSNQARRYSGVVVDEKGEPVIGANVIVKGATGSGTITDIDGKFALNVSQGTTLVVSYIGFSSVEIIAGSQTDLKITMREDSELLGEVVVVGYGTQKKAHLSGAVSTISSKQMENRPVINANAALQGLAPNVNIRLSSGNPTQAPEINVRGYTSINGGSALILVDNVPMTPEEFGRINPADIESVSVLKDAASAAIYGARAAFGVILVTTKTAKSEKLEISADVNYAYRSEINYFKYDMDLVNFMEVINLVGGDGSYTAAQIDYARQRMKDPSLPEIRMPGDPKYPSLDAENRYDYYAMTDWHELYTNPSPMTLNANVSIGQRNERMNFMTSAAILSNDGMYVGEKPYKRYNIRSGGNYKLFKWWTVGANITYNRSEWDTPYTVGTSGANGTIPSLAGMYIKNPPKNPDGTWTESGGGLGELLDGGRWVRKQNDTQFTFNTTFDVIKDIFTIKADANIRLYNENRDSWQLSIANSRSPGRIDYAHPTSVTYEGKEDMLTTMNLYGDFHKTFAGKHFVQALAGFNQEHTSKSNTWVSQQGLISENYPSLVLATGSITRSQSKSALSLRGVFGRLNYTFNNKYIAEFNGRYDGTSRFAQGRRFGFFPSATGAYLISNEKFFEAVRETLPISFLKLRASYGSLGNQGKPTEGYYPYFSTMANPSEVNMFIDGSRPLGIKRPDGEAAGNLTWEAVRTINFGANIGLLNDRLSIEFDRYTRYTEGMLAPAKAIPAQFGADVARSNAADLKTQGWELDITWRDETKLAGSPLNYSVRFMLSDARAWITKYDNPDKLLNTSISNPTYYEGQEIGEIWGFEVPGLFKSKEEADLWWDQTPIQHPARTELTAGDMKFNDLNGDGVINKGKGTVDDPGDRRIIGNTASRYPYSIDLSASWRGFDIRAFLQGVGKRDWYPENANSNWWYTEKNPYVEFWSSYLTTWRTPSIYIRDHWTPENPDGYYPRMFHRSAQNANTAEWMNANTRYMQDASYLRLKNVTLGYTLPEKLTGKAGISRLRVYFSGENLWTWSHLFVDAIDPETLGDNYSTYAMQKIFSLGLNINF